MVELEAASVSTQQELKEAMARLGEASKAQAEGETLYMHTLLRDALVADQVVADKLALTKLVSYIEASEAVTNLDFQPSLSLASLPSEAEKACAEALAAMAQSHSQIAGLIAACRKRVASHKPRAVVTSTLVETDGDGEADEAQQSAQAQTMLVYSCRSLIEASRSCVNDLASGSVHSLAQLGALGLQALLQLEHAMQRERTNGVDTASAEPATLSAGSMASGLLATLLQELATLQLCYLGAAREAVELAESACADGPTAQLLPQLEAVQAALSSCEKGLSIDVAEVRARLCEAAGFLMPLCTFLTPVFRQQSDAGLGAEPTVAEPAVTLAAADGSVSD